MTRLMGIIYAAVAALVIGMAPVPSANAAALFAGSGGVIRDTAPAVTDEVRWRGGGRGFRGYRGYRGYRRGYYRPYRFYRPYYRPAYVGPACFWRPARWVWTPYGQRFVPARRVCRW